jgi:UDP-4-amino-4,6-dideoxy-N-acetyl-beta-L-altrosamine N-acetyltransferase
MALPVCSVRLLARDDIERVRQWRNQDRIRRNMYTTEPISAMQQQAWFEGLEGDATRHFTLFLQDGRPVGCLYFTAIHDGEAQLGYYLGEEQVWPGLGLLLELAALDYGFGRIGLDTLLAEVLEFNSVPQKIHDLFGYERLGLRTEATRRDGQPVAAVVFRYLRSDWHNRRADILQRLPKQIREAAALLQT